MDRNEAMALWSMIVEQARSRVCRSINVGTANRRQVILAINEIVRAALDAQEPTCVWTQNRDDWYSGDYYETACSHSWFFAEGNLEDNAVVFCPFCGQKIEEKIDGK